jgi:hypothetical protein
MARGPGVFSGEVDHARCDSWWSSRMSGRIVDTRRRAGTMLGYNYQPL